MFIRKQDFMLRAEHFNFLQPWNTLRIISGAFLLPHALSKFSGFGLNPGTVGFFAKAGFAPPELWVLIAAAGELVLGLCLILGLATRFVALGAAVLLLVAAYALYTVTGGWHWYWNGGGFEYLIFWAIVCLLVAQHEFQANKSLR